MKTRMRTLGSVLVVEVSGIVNREATGPLCDALVDGIQNGARKLIVDLSHASCVTRAGVRGLVVAAKLMQSGRGAMRVSGARGTAAELLDGLGHNYLIVRDPTIEAALAALGEPAMPEAAEARAA